MSNPAGLRAAGIPEELIEKISLNQLTQEAQVHLEDRLCQLEKLRAAGSTDLQAKFTRLDAKQSGKGELSKLIKHVTEEERLAVVGAKPVEHKCPLCGQKVVGADSPMVV